MFSHLYNNHFPFHVLALVLCTRRSAASRGLLSLQLFHLGGSLGRTPGPNLLFAGRCAR